ncbi:hypothetical protein KGF56_000202 [Candida oxycetoniae]|uniref:Cyclin-D1-binding protein 1-like N-terminal domain-containing protein n=1 Tax=Candida oxycetoniae TaxID=497107 RepID=A0AAI9X0E3_9ASCO|nr:uncharacterized protein KGF56_000202 [Candida oxycetoniae]KAI3406910.2 hypothetical protein KGF56_000202 [Candida oxycetoniae]
MSIDLQALITSFQDATKFWIVSLGTDKITQVKASKVEDPLGELLKLVKLIKAHTTKVGIVFKPGTLVKEEKTAYSTLEKLSETLIFTVSVIAQLKAKEISKVFYEEIVIQVKQLIGSSNILANELLSIHSSECGSDDDDDSGEGRLVSVGKIWSNCDSLTKLINEGALGLLTEKIKQSIALIDDGFDEFVEWAENPEDIDDPFGFSDEGETDEDEEKKTDFENEETEEEEEKEKEEENVSNEEDFELIKYSKKLIKKIELIKLLLSSFKKSLPKTITGSQIDEIYQIQKTLVNHIDKIIIDLMLERSVSDETISTEQTISSNSIKLSKLAESIHKDNKKSSWYTTWATKYNI